jgi:hypothetical protein
MFQDVSPPSLQVVVEAVGDPELRRAAKFNEVGKRPPNALDRWISARGEVQDRVGRDEPMGCFLGGWPADSPRAAAAPETGSAVSAGRQSVGRSLG